MKKAYFQSLVMRLTPVLVQNSLFKENYS